jgi:hypothetical protein
MNERFGKNAVAARPVSGTRVLRIAAALVATALAAGPIAARAAVVCQKKKHVTLRAKTCRKGEQLVADVTNAVASHTTDLTTQGAELDELKLQLGFTCSNDPGRKLVVSKFTGPVFYSGALTEKAGGGCRSLDGNQTACTAAFQNGDPFGDLGTPAAQSCFYFKGRCLPCQSRADATGGCHNTCVGPAVQCADATRTTFAGGPANDACERFGVQADCEKAWHVGRLGAQPLAATCYWNGACHGCGPHHSAAGDCTNSCTPGPLVTCKDATRVTFAGGRGSNPCGSHDNDQAGCLKAYHFGRDGIPAPCWYDTGDNHCRGCGLRFEVAGLCTNTCL